MNFKGISELDTKSLSSFGPRKKYHIPEINTASSAIVKLSTLKNINSRDKSNELTPCSKAVVKQNVRLNFIENIRLNVKMKYFTDTSYLLGTEKIEL